MSRESNAESALQGILNWLFLLCVVVAMAAHARSCFVSPRRHGEGTAKLVELDATNVAHQRISAALDRAWFAGLLTARDPDLKLLDSEDVNAASFGAGRFLFFTGVGDLSTSAVDAIAAHEVAHDALHHTRDIEEVAELTDWLGKAVGVLGHADADASRVIQEWAGLAVLPKYSREQEFEADTKAVEILKRLGYETPEETMANALQILQGRYGNDKDASGGGFFSTHPATLDRISRLRADAGR